MGTRVFRGATVAALLAAAALVGGCGGGSSSSALLAGDWSGSLSIGYQGGGGASGALELDLDQSGDFVSGAAIWQPVGSTQSVTGPIEGDTFTLLLHFRCDAKPETTELTGSVNGAAMTITGASGSACTGGGGANAVSGASGSLTRSSNNLPL